MSFDRVPAANGLQWLTESVQLILKNPVPFALMGLVMAVIGIVPILGSLALLILGPALYGGMMYAAREERRGGKADFQHLFQAFREPGKLGKMIMLCVPSLVAGLILVLLGVIILGGAILGAGVSGSSSSGAIGAGLGIGGVIFMLLALAVGLAVFALTFFATPGVMLGSAEPIPAMKDSVQACLANVGAVLIYFIVLFVVVMVLGTILSFIPILGHLVLMTALFPVVSVAIYTAWTQVYRDDSTQELPPVVPPQPPAAF